VGTKDHAHDLWKQRRNPVGSAGLLFLANVNTQEILDAEIARLQHAIPEVRDIHLRARVLACADGANPVRVGANHGRKKVRAVWRQGYVPESVSSHFRPLLGVIPYTRAIRKPKQQRLG
jgi:hypothetical protein